MRTPWGPGRPSAGALFQYQQNAKNVMPLSAARSICRSMMASESSRQPQTGSRSANSSSIRLVRCVGGLTRSTTGLPSSDRSCPPNHRSNRRRQSPAYQRIGDGLQLCCYSGPAMPARPQRGLRRPAPQPASRATSASSGIMCSHGQDSKGDIMGVSFRAEEQCEGSRSTHRAGPFSRAATSGMLAQDVARLGRIGRQVVELR